MSVPQQPEELPQPLLVGQHLPPADLRQRLQQPDPIPPQVQRASQQAAAQIHRPLQQSEVVPHAQQNAARLAQRTQIQQPPAGLPLHELTDQLQQIPQLLQQNQALLQRLSFKRQLLFTVAVAVSISLLLRLIP